MIGSSTDGAAAPRPIAPSDPPPRPAAQPRPDAAGRAAAQPRPGEPLSPKDAMRREAQGTGGPRGAATEESAARAFRALLGQRVAGREGKGAWGGFAGSDERAAAELPAGDAGVAATRAESAVAPQPVAATALGVEPQAAAAVERLAAAVAEALARGRDPVFTVAFNDPGALAQGAVLIRESTGALSVRLEGVAAAALAIAPGRLEEQLRAALDRRRVRLGRLEWGAQAPALHVSRTPPRRFAEGAGGAGAA